jgi:poly-beta-1,6-N-acetyl-D-glucosamine synthase
MLLNNSKNLSEKINIMSNIEIVFWSLILLVFYTYLGYSMVLLFLVKLKSFYHKKNKEIRFPYKPYVTILVAAYNEKNCIKEKVTNTLELDYPKDKLQIIFITDGSNDGTHKILKNYKEITLLHHEKRQGKTQAINRAMKFVNNPIVIFSDANAMLNKRAVLEIVKHYTDPKIGCVSGEKRILKLNTDNASGSGEGFYWKYESFLKSLDFKLNSTVGAAGELFSIRTKLYENVNKNTILDDFIISMKIAEKGYKIAYEPNAFASESASLSITEEMKRKIRISAGGIQSIFMLLNILNIYKYPTLSFQYISHRVLRWTIAPFAFFLLIPINVILVYTKDYNIYYIILFGQITFYILALIGLILEQKKIKIKMVFVPFYFTFMNLCVIIGLTKFVKGNHSAVWEKSIRA